jgi:hypothetical protein
VFLKVLASTCGFFGLSVIDSGVSSAGGFEGYWEQEETGDVPSICPETTPDEMKLSCGFLVFVVI